MNELVQSLIKFDKEISQKLFNIRPQNPKFEKLVFIITRGYGLLPVIIILFLLSKNIALTALWLVVILFANALIVELGIKKIIKRERPTFLGRTFNSYSFPSTHSTAMTMAFLHMLVNSTLYSNYEILLILLGLWGSFTILSRIIFGYHYIFDTFFGIIIGIIIYLPLHLLFAAV